MAYNQAVFFLAFLPLTLILYRITPKKLRWVTLLVMSYGFYILNSRKLVVYLLCSSLITYAVGMWISSIGDRCKLAIKDVDKDTKKQLKSRYKRYQKYVLILGIVCLLSSLLTIKYFNFFAENTKGLFRHFGMDISFPALKLLMPLGISFYTLEAIGYITDIYWGKIKVQKNPLKVALFLGFFPQIMEGPIAAYADTSEGLFSGADLTEDNLLRGSVRIIWGVFKKSVIADRLFVIVQTLFGNYSQYSGMMIVVAAVAYTIQLYMEFSGVIDIVIGSGRLFGVNIPENFRQPFASKNASEFWRRWHISLGVWFRTYIFYPVSMSKVAKKWNQFSKKKSMDYIGKVVVSAMALFPVWLCNGLWHGANWTFIFYGMYYFVIILLEIVLEPVTAKITSMFKSGADNPVWKLIQIIKTWIIIFSGELFFNSRDLKSGFEMYGSIFKDFRLSTLWDSSLLGLGLDRLDFIVIFAGLVLVAIVSHFREKNIDVHDKIAKACLPVRWAAYIGLIMLVVIFGAYGPGYQEVNLIYAGF